jgi:hypothetical protein
LFADLRGVDALLFTDPRGVWNASRGIDLLLFTDPRGVDAFLFTDPRGVDAFLFDADLVLLERTGLLAGARGVNTFLPLDESNFLVLLFSALASLIFLRSASTRAMVF